jgi:hypothetical protein
VGKPKVEAIQKPLVSFPLGALSRVVTGFTFAVQTASSFSETVAEFLEDLTDGMTAGDEIAETETTLEKLDNILPPSEQDHLAIDGTGLEPTALRANSNIAGYNPISTPTGTPGTAANPWLTGVHSAASGGGAGTGLPMGYNAFGASSPSVINLGERSANSYADFFHGPEVPVLIFTLSNVNTQRVQLEDLCRKLELALEEARQQLSAIPELPERAGYEVFAKVVDTVEGLIRQTHNKLLHIYRGYRGSAAALEHQSLLASIKRVSGLINSSLEASKQFILFHSSLTHASKGSPSSSHTSLMQANNKLVEALANCVHELCDEQPLTTEARSAVPQDGGGAEAILKRIIDGVSLELPSDIMSTLHGDIDGITEYGELPSDIFAVIDLEVHSFYGTCDVPYLPALCSLVREAMTLSRKLAISQARLLSIFYNEDIDSSKKLTSLRDAIRFIRRTTNIAIHSFYLFTMSEDDRPRERDVEDAMEGSQEFIKMLKQKIYKLRCTVELYEGMSESDPESISNSFWELSETLERIIKMLRDKTQELREFLVENRLFWERP